ncbi:ABC transporter ATP-binding protein [Oscillibacter sp. MSJ-2]|uniref:ABC transporter ATP-binding protein n=1 Tax=Dysosmobacter acutus TaxID=2841504 RepID=A0ABS6F5W7_9FIRM|nr:ABC transporter ATP-binding protein [Dysosmobacter acutus]MBU5625557.1 ABC transporter ATP-binding protein [Dysosmobacter acutus]
MAFLEMNHIYKSFGTTAANKDVHLSVEQGEIHAILGENGAGKSTLMNILYGMYAPDSGEILLRGQNVRFFSSGDAIAQGIGMVHQHFMLIPEQTVIENVVLGGAENPFVLNLKEQARRFTELAHSYSMDIDPWCRVEQLSVGQQQRLEILKALYKKADLLILDEPTAVLTPREVQELFRMMRQLSAQGCTILFITHKLPEIMDVCTRCTILRQGETVCTMPITPEVNRHDLAVRMVGREVELGLSKESAKPGDPVLQVEHLSYVRPDGVEAVRDVSFSVREGEIVGICGVDGNGQSELIRCITGLLRPSSGEALVEGKPCKSAKQVLRQGVAHIPEDRLKMAVVKEMSIGDNMVLMHYDQVPLCRRGLIDWKAARQRGSRICQEYQVRMAGLDQAVQELSGGNQQKMVVGRELDWDPRLLIAVHPSRGLDIGATRYIQNSIIAARQRGTAVLVVSTELEEIMELSDRILVIFSGRIMADLTQSQATRETLGALMAGIKEEGNHAG